MLNISTFLTPTHVNDIPFDSEFQIHYSFNVFGETKIAMNTPFNVKCFSYNNIPTAEMEHV